MDGGIPAPVPARAVIESSLRNGKICYGAGSIGSGSGERPCRVGLSGGVQGFSNPPTALSHLLQ